VRGGEGGERGAAAACFAQRVGCVHGVEGARVCRDMFGVWYGVHIRVSLVTREYTSALCFICFKECYVWYGIGALIKTCLLVQAGGQQCTSHC
jgi:hypothetical protein